MLSAEFDVQGEHSEIVKREETLNYSYNDINFSLVKEYVDSDPKEFTLTLHGSSKNDNNVVFYPVMELLPTWLLLMKMLEDLLTYIL